MSENFYELQWSKDGGDMSAGAFSSKADALAVIKSACKGFNDQRDSGVDSEFKVEDFHVHYTGPEFIVENIRVANEEGELFAHFTVRQIDTYGDETVTDTGEWIDYDDGLLEATDSSLACSGHFDRNERANIHDIVNDHFRVNPIDEDLLESYQLAAESRREGFRLSMQ